MDIFFLLIGMALLTIAYGYIYHTYLSLLVDIENKWMVTTAIIKTLKIRPITRSKLFYESIEDYNSRVIDNTRLELIYEYRVNGQQYRNGRIDPVQKDGEALKSLNKARFDLLSSQQTLDILYNPNDPSQSYIKQDLSLYRHLRWMVTGAYSIGMLLCLGGIVLTITGVF